VGEDYDSKPWPHSGARICGNDFWNGNTIEYSRKSAGGRTHRHGEEGAFVAGRRRKMRAAKPTDISQLTQVALADLIPHDLPASNSGILCLHVAQDQAAIFELVRPDLTRPFKAASRGNFR
jgi:hypothetical protein